MFIYFYVFVLYFTVNKVPRKGKGERADSRSKENHNPAARGIKTTFTER